MLSDFMSSYHLVSLARLTRWLVAGLLAVNTTILAYAGIIVAAGVVVGLVLYFIATNPQQRSAFTVRPNDWDFSLPRYYGSNSYNSNYYSQSRMLHDASSYMENFDLLGLVTKAVQVYNKLNEEDEWVPRNQDILSLSVRR